MIRIRDMLLLFLTLLVNFHHVNGVSVFPPKSPYNEVEARALLNLAAAAYAPTPDECARV